MPEIVFFPQRPDCHPTIYAYELVGVASHVGYCKIGYTERDVEIRVKEQLHTSAVKYRILGSWSAMKNDGSCFTDHDVHALLKKRGKRQLNAGEDRNEWFQCGVRDIESAVLSLQRGIANQENRTRDFSMRPEQREAVEKTAAYFRSLLDEKHDRTRIPRFLWNAKMRFGKTFTAYQLAKKMGFSKILILTFKPAVKDSWREDLMTHVDFEGWQFITRPTDPREPSTDEQYRCADMSRPIVCFGSFQDFLGVNRETGGIKANNEWVHTTNWDLVIFDEYHFGAWKDSAKKLFEEDEDSCFNDDLSNYDAGNAYNETWLPITTSFYLYLSGTPFRAINSGEFIEEQIFTWTYSDEQSRKESWQGPNNPYAALPRMVLMVYKIPESINRIVRQGEFDDPDNLNLFFSAEGQGDDARFKFESYVQKWLDLIRGSYLETSVDEIKLGAEKPPMPYADTRLLNVLSHTLWFLPSVASCYAMRNLMNQRQNQFFHDGYQINVCAGTQAGIGAAALEPVRASMDDPLKTRTITLSCGKLMTGVTVKPWTGIFMLRNLSSPETYFQAAFRVQSPWEIMTDKGQRQIMKQECYVFDFALNRALRQVSDYSRSLDTNETNPEKKVSDFIKFLPVLAYDGSAMRKISAEDILDITTAGTSATLLARRWESALLVNVDNDTLARLLASDEAMEALMKIEGFRSLNQDIQTIINKSEKVKQAKRDKVHMSEHEKKELSDEEKDYKSKRKMIQQKLIKFATRIPIFMYLTDFREMCLRDVITDLEPDMFRKVTGLTVKDFDLLVSLDLFNSSLMDDAVFKFKRYEDASLTYTGINRHSGEDVGLYSTVITREDYDAMARQQTLSMQAEPQTEMPSEPVRKAQTSSQSVPQPAAQTARHPSAPGQQTKLPNAVIQQPIPQPKPTPAVQSTFSEADIAGIREGVSVRHKAFKDGQVTKIEENVIYVSFAKGEKKFPFPDAFYQGFLSVKKDN